MPTTTLCGSSSRSGSDDDRPIERCSGRENLDDSTHTHTMLIQDLKVPAAKGLGAQQKTNIPLPSTEVFPLLQSTTAEDILYRRMHISACRKQGTHVLRGVGEAHVLQLL